MHILVKVDPLHLITRSVGWRFGLQLLGRSLQIRIVQVSSQRRYHLSDVMRLFLKNLQATFWHGSYRGIVYLTKDFHPFLHSHNTVLVPVDKIVYFVESLVRGTGFICQKKQLFNEGVKFRKFQSSLVNFVKLKKNF